MSRSIIAVLFVLLVSTAALAEIPQVLGYQGRVTDNGGVPVADGTYAMRFRIYTAETGGTLLWDSGYGSEQLTGGIFNVMLGESPQPALILAFDRDYWLLVTFDWEDQLPRKRLGSVGYAYMASGLVPGTLVEGSVTSGTYAAIKGTNTATTGNTYGGRFESSSTSGRSVYGYATATTGPTEGVHGQSVSTDGLGVYGYATASSGTTCGVWGQSYSTAGTGVYGNATANTGTNYGVYGRSAAVSGTGVYGNASANTGSTNGGFFEADSPNGTGVQGEGDFRGGRFKDMDSNNYCYAGYDTYKTYGTGTNAFVQNHPRDNERVIVYAAPEGDEVATYTRGTARLEKGEARVSLGETFKWVTSPDIGLTAHLTPRGKGTVLFVESLTTEQMVVRSMDGFPDDVVFDYVVYGLRIGFEEVSIVQEKQEESYIPSMAGHRALYARHPELRKHNSLERFASMRAGVGQTGPLDLSASQALRGAIEEYDPAVHGPSDHNRGEKARMEEGRRRAEDERDRMEQEHTRMEEEGARLRRESPVNSAE
jgi:hypothetical protein